MEYKAGTLPNGIRYIHQPINGKVAHCGIIINTGSRDELDHEHGIAHFIEHAIFKGTGKRKAYHILSRMDDIGGEIDAYTSKEDTVLHATFMPMYYERSLELLYDMVFNSTFPEKELKNEKEVVYDEIASYKDSPSELIYDDFEELIYNNHALGRNILGTKKILKKIGKNEILNFINRTYCTDQMVICSVGSIDFKRFEKLILKHFASIPANISSGDRKKFTGYTPNHKKLNKRTHQHHCIIGNEAYDIYDNKRYALGLLNNLIAGPALNSRLNLSLRERHGLVYTIESSYNPYSDTGIFTLYFGTDKSNFDKCINLINKEFKTLRDNKLGTLQLQKAQRQIIGQMMINAESNTNQLMHLGKSHLYYNEVMNLEEANNIIMKLSAEDILEVANEILDPQKLSVLIYQ